MIHKSNSHVRGDEGGVWRRCCSRALWRKIKVQPAEKACLCEVMTATPAMAKRHTGDCDGKDGEGEDDGNGHDGAN